MEPTVALCMIVRNEQSALPRCLESVASAVDAIYITDTGSTDNTVDIARQFGAHIRQFAWGDDFAAARNHSIQDIPHPWLLILDADDYFPAGEATKLRPALQTSDTLTLTVDYTVAEGFTPVPTRRLLRNNSGLRFEGYIHESIRNSLPKTSANHTADTGIQLIHTGYTQAAQPAKLKRNLPLLEKELARCKKTSDTLQQMVIGRELAWTWLQLGEPSRGEMMLRSLLTDWSSNDEMDAYAVEVFSTLSWHLQSHQKSDEGWQLAQAVAPKLSQQPAFSLYHGLAAFQNAQFATALGSLTAFEKSLQTEKLRSPVPLIYTGIGLWDLLGQCHLNLGAGAQAKALFAKCLASGGDSQEYAAKLQLAERFTP